jgi:hypothetical protein
MISKRKSKRRVFALQELRKWLSDPVEAPIKRDADSVPCRGSWIVDLGLPPNKKDEKAKDFAIFLLQAGAEIEHSLLVQYLYAAYSIDERTEGLENTFLLEWKRDIRLVAREEMAHLVTVQNILLALGEDAHMNRTPLHRKATLLPFPYKLEPLSRESLGKYVLLESPTSDQMKPDEEEDVEEISRRLPGSAKMLRVGSIYAAVYWLLMENDAPDVNWPFSESVVCCFTDEYGDGFHLKNSDFVDEKEYLDRAADPKEWGVFESGMHVDGTFPREKVLAGLRWLMAQGEGPNAIEDSHFHRFLRMYREFEKPGASVEARIFHVPDNPRIRGANGGESRGKEVGTLIKNERSSLWGRVFNVRYQLLLLDILESLGTRRSKETAKRETLTGWAVLEMEFLKRIGQLLPLLFLDRNDKKRAGAPFQATVFPASEKGRQDLRRRLLEESERRIAALTDKRGKVVKYTKDPEVELAPALEAGLADAIARQDDEMRNMN